MSGGPGITNKLTLVEKTRGPSKVKLHRSCPLLKVGVRGGWAITHCAGNAPMPGNGNVLSGVGNVHCNLGSKWYYLIQRRQVVSGRIKEASVDLHLTTYIHTVLLYMGRADSSLVREWVFTNSIEGSR
jgi:hypothetical protein